MIAVWIVSYAIVGMTAPSMTMGDVRLDQVGGGGSLGRWLTGGSVTLVWVWIAALLLVAWAACWPARAKSALLGLLSPLRRTLLIGQVDGTPAQDSPWLPLFERAGFAATSQGLFARYSVAEG